MSFGDPWFYVVLLGAAALVYALLLPGRQASSPKNDAAKEMEATLEQYMSEIERENQELIDLVSQMKQEFASKQLAQQEQTAELRKRLSDVEFSARQSEARLESLAASAGENVSAVSVPAAAAAEASLTIASAPFPDKLPNGALRPGPPRNRRLHRRMTEIMSAAGIRNCLTYMKKESRST
ncbi:hypothetical protein HMSSN036_36570 [Paenibacillus macerans]|nr:hypothetical protein HMSSN036_36570 [Paenibacillus macerans]